MCFFICSIEKQKTRYQDIGDLLQLVQMQESKQLGLLACRASIDERQQAEKMKQVTENSSPGYEFISGHRRDYCGFATGIEVDV